MKKVNTNDLQPEEWTSPRGTFRGSGIEVSIALGRDPLSSDHYKRHPFDVEILRVPPGAKAYPYHSHSAQWEFYHVVSGSGLARDEDGSHPVVAGDAFIFQPGEAHQLINNGTEDLVAYVIADNPYGESCHYPDSSKWLVRSPERRLMRSESLDYFDGEE